MSEQQQALLSMESNAPKIHNGTYTVEVPGVDHGRIKPEIPGHWTLKLHTAQHGALKGRRIISLLTGPDNTSSYSGVAFLDGKTVQVWRKFQSPLDAANPDGLIWYKSWSLVQKKVAVWLNLAMYDGRGYWNSHGYILHRESRCIRCNRALTTPNSIRLGIGPECATKGN